ncbi:MULTISPECIES: ABC transporter ATP-binding protein [unclassified Paenibacillus]|uniref:ABC transporter ATP-binding protein n=1 Tax=unclassified Paenibacillus TaxID=185978 RepID=UPI00095717C7|nr:MULTISPECIES: ABC transporter ATP-binding protein [unclassified Paenibacillus]ASS67766.1 ABC transporter ATP-binding protein [Paenibacillus sp. RUD330]SIR61207.1 ABC-2 type transport system ATP-binding protein [Paenibacillus sp. RU4X]SIR69844.1 ABC-2 type transport system ATP-binding protein [Paenibacillus sp. RU4T]
MTGDYVLQTNQLSKKFKSSTALHNVELSIRKGSIYGFIGQNGAGKSTLIRIVAGLAFPTEGSIELFGASDERSLIEARKRIGSIIESPALFPHMTASENLEANRILRGIPGKDCVPRTLELVGLQGTGKKKAKNFSLGMKQRLGLAIALLGDPEFLILDEPTNGLDPMGVVEMRELLKRLNRERGITILISSHILSELYLLASHYGIIHRGQLLEQLTAQELNGKCQQYVLIKADNPNMAAAVVQRELGTAEFEVLPDGAIKLYSPIDQPGKVSSALFSAGLEIEQFTPMGEDLESYFTKRIGGGSHV